MDLIHQKIDNLRMKLGDTDKYMPRAIGYLEIYKEPKDKMSDDALICILFVGGIITIVGVMSFFII